MSDEMVDIRLIQLPVAYHLAATEHIDGLIREFRWLDADPTDTPVRVLQVGAKISRTSSSVMDPLTRVITDAHLRGQPTVDLEFPVPPMAAGLSQSVQDLLDEADEFCRTGGMLTLATPAPALHYRRWFLGEFIRQVGGEPPTPWPDSPHAAALAAGSD